MIEIQKNVDKVMYRKVMNRGNEYLVYSVSSDSDCDFYFLVIDRSGNFRELNPKYTVMVEGTYDIDDFISSDNKEVE